MTLSEIRDILEADVLIGHDRLHLRVRGGFGSDLLSDMLHGPTNDVVLLTGLTNIQVVRSSVVSAVTAIVIVGGKTPSSEIITQAQAHELPLMVTPFTMFTSCGKLFAQGLPGIDCTKGD
ncbi:MAG: DRTGG domain-containing protein [Pseudomonadota bacterium]